MKSNIAIFYSGPDRNKEEIEVSRNKSLEFNDAQFKTTTAINLRDVVGQYSMVAIIAIFLFYAGTAVNPDDNLMKVILMHMSLIFIGITGVFSVLDAVSDFKNDIRQHKMNVKCINEHYDNIDSENSVEHKSHLNGNIQDTVCHFGNMVKQRQIKNNEEMK
ncbi:hypothetical protein [Pseudomonas sp. HY7a-MNA-CIBAN-0227]|uniref:hypothetical protein n=1 Tax=Pseudomonas sp. HY7a-MNA-CIBAN-0227 TaxID=3140474 RepID=UPI0033231785